MLPNQAYRLWLGFQAAAAWADAHKLVLPHFAWFYIDVPEKLAGTRMSKPQVSNGTTIKPMQDIPSMLIPSTQSAEEPKFSTLPQNAGL
jgi:hypothetical protein